MPSRSCKRSGDMWVVARVADPRELRVVVLQNILAPYRVPLFDALSARVSKLTVLVSAYTERRRPWTMDLESVGFACEKLPGATIRTGYESEVQLSAGLLAALSRIQPDVVVCSGYSAQTMQALLWRRLTGGAVVVWTEAHVHQRRRLRQALTRHVDAFIVAGSQSRDRVLEMGAAGDTVFVAHNSVDLSVYDLAVGGEQPCAVPEFVCVGALIERKGVRDVVAASDLLAQAGVEHGVVFVGDGPLRPELEQRIADEDAPWEVTGWLPPREVARHCNRAAASILASRFDLNPLALVESLCCGTPVIASDGVGSTRDFIEPGVNGAVFPRGDAAQLMREMSEFASGAAVVASRASISSRARVEFSPDAAADMMLRAVNFAAAARLRG